MKKLLVFILILVSKPIIGCGFHPLNEEFRYCFLRPQWFDLKSYTEFHYSANAFEPNFTYDEFQAMPNELLWVKYCRNKVSFQSIREVLEALSYGDIKADSKNQMLQYLFKNKDDEAINYLKFAKNCEFFNTWLDDPWERNMTMTLPQRTKLLNQAVKISKNIKNEDLKLRYAFLAIRLAFYNRDFEIIREIFDAIFQQIKEKNILYYWSLYFRTIAEPDTVKASFFAAQVFVHAPDKRFMVMQHYNTQTNVLEVLKFAKTNIEKANVYFLAAIKKHDKSLDYIKKVYALQPNFHGLDLILLREVNKLEDWILTPYFSQFEPSVSGQNYWDENENDFSNLQKRVISDRKYAQELLNFITKVDLREHHNQTLWKFSKAYLNYLTQNYETSLFLLDELKSKTKIDKEKQHIDLLRALVLTANQPKGEGVIMQEVKSIILNHKNHKKFIFAIGRELEYLGNTTDAALLYAKIERNYGNEEGYYGDENASYWRNKNAVGGYINFFSHYFDYLNVVYTPKQMEDLIENILINHTKKDVFSVYLYQNITTNVSQLYDLLGTKYIRINHLSKALANFKKVNQFYWNEAYSAWEKNEDEYTLGNHVFDKNPFFELKYTPKFIPKQDSIRLNKKSIVNQLIRYINKAENPKEPNKDYYYFLVANGYFNMTYYGNSWMMRRYYHSTNIQPIAMVDDAEYFQCNSAKTYYLLALKHAKTEKFKALCLRMIGRCEKNRLTYNLETKNDIEYENQNEYLFQNNPFYQDLKKNYANYYDDLMTNCASFENYFSARR